MSWSDPDAAKMFAEYIDASITQETGIKIFDTIHKSYDVGHPSPNPVPTLVAYRPEFPFAGTGVIEDIADHIPGSTLVPFEGTAAVPYGEDWRAVFRTMSGFLGITPGDARRQDGRTSA
jgi:hypothetical protein